MSDPARPPAITATLPLTDIVVEPGGETPLGFRRQLILATYWFSLSFQGGALLGVAVPAQLLALVPNSNKTWILGLVGGVAAFLGMVAQPIAGALSDFSVTRWGRRRPYLVGGALLDIAGLAVMIAATNLALLFLGFAIASVGAAISGAAYQAYLPDHVPPAQYGIASGYVGALTMIGTVASFGLAGALVSPTNAAPFYLATIVAIGAGAAFTAVAIDDPLGARPSYRGGLSWRALWLDPWRHPDFVLVFATRAMMMLALYTLFTFVEYYMQDVVHVTQFVQGAAIVAGVATIAALVGGIFTGWLSDKTGRKPIVSGASVLMATGLTVLAFAHSLNVVLGVGVVFGLALGAYSAVDWALAIDVLPDRAFAAKDLGLWGISSNLPQTLAPLVGGAVLLALSPFGSAVGFGALFLGAAACAASSGLLVWRLKTVR